ncbi:DUF4124 domain-containing protein [Noviherbaspirillum sedimenti]|uniref:DUF4124 domain-containing protein n=1 Tax=Noviherbaspirillum sedimenti TaxID=2320865 RepID=A0A3A3FZ14_9BURK|nr:DUF4124 domain-containing protein [Noviherbaspirillum sedimenti]RJG00881.1 DUF4124 domain-containing protein [Noviherbaspirillum sedimenti]
MQFIPVKQLAASLVLCAFASVAWAQYVWTDEKGAKQFSDMPPPASVPKNRILKQPGGAFAAPVTATASASAAPANADDAAPKTPLSTAEKNADFMKRRTEQAEKDKKAASEAQAARDKAQNCDKARKYQSALASGQRMASTDSNGERVFLEDEQRSREMRETNRILADCK